MRADIKIIATEHRCGRDEVLIVLVQTDAGEQRAYIGTPKGNDPDVFDVLFADYKVNSSAEYVVDWGCKLSYREAAAFFDEPILIQGKYVESGDL